MLEGCLLLQHNLAYPYPRSPWTGWVPKPTTPIPAQTGGKPHHVPRILKQLLGLLFQNREQSSIPSYLKSFRHNRGVK